MKRFFLLLLFSVIIVQVYLINSKTKPFTIYIDPGHGGVEYIIGPSIRSLLIFVLFYFERKGGKHALNNKEV